jgi:hypothetical protein
MGSFDDTDFFMDASLVENPYPYFEPLRQKGPAVYLPRHNVLAVTSFEERGQCELIRDYANPLPLRADPSDKEVVDRAGFEPAYACAGRFTVCCL